MVIKKMKVCLGWHENPPTGYVVSCKNVRDEVCILSWTWLGIAWSIMGKSRLSTIMYFWRTWMTGKMIYAKSKKVGLSNCASFSYSNVLRRLTNGHVFGCYSSKKFVSYVQEHAIVPKPHMGDLIEVCGHGCEEGNIQLEKSLWIFVVLKWKTFPTSSLISSWACLHEKYFRLGPT